MVTHFPWDDGAISGTWLSVGQKTIKGQCGKRVAFSTMTLTGAVTCPGCRAKMQADAYDLEQFAVKETHSDSEHIRNFATTLGAKAKHFREVLART